MKESSNYSTNVTNINSKKADIQETKKMSITDYELYIGEDGVQRVRKYNPKTKMWLTIKFNGDGNSEQIQRYTTDTLKKQFIDRILNGN